MTLQDNIRHVLKRLAKVGVCVLHSASRAEVAYQQKKVVLSLTLLVCRTPQDKETKEEPKRSSGCRQVLHLANILENTFKANGHDVALVLCHHAFLPYCLVESSLGHKDRL